MNYSLIKLKGPVALLITLSIFSTSYAQMYSEPKKAEVKPEKPKKQAAPKDTAGKKYLAGGLIINATAAVTRGITSGNYNYSIYNSSYVTPSYISPIQNSFGYRLGIGIGFQTRSFGMEIPIVFCVDRFKVPAISTKDHLKISSFEFGLNQYWRFIKEKHYIMLGEYIATFASQIDLGIDDWHSAGFNFGYGYCILKNLNVSLRFKYNFNSLAKDDDGVVEIYTYEGAKNPIYTTANYNSLQLVARYDFVNTRKIKTIKKREPRVKKSDYEYMNNPNTYNPPPAPSKPAIDYSRYSDTDLNIALKEANTKSDLDAMLAIQKELDARKAQNEFSGMSNVQLEQSLGKALDAEDYKKAELIKKEIAKRDTQKGMPSNNSVDNLESKSVEELTKLKDEAVQKEDYEKAKQIQEIINAKKPK